MSAIIMSMENKDGKKVPMKIIRPKGNRYQILFDLQAGREILSGINGNPDPFILESPSMIDIGIMGHCLNRCKICYQGDESQPNMTLDDFRFIVSNAKSYVNQVALGGRGDPNLHESFGDILRICKENFIVPNYTTSGNSLTDEQVEYTKKYCGAVAVSNYGQDFTFSALNKFMSANMKTNIHFVISTETFNDAIRLLNGEDIWDGRVDISKLNAVVFLLFKPQGRGTDKKDLILTKEMITQLSNSLMSPKCTFKVGCDSCLFNKVSQTRELTESEKISVDTCEGSRMSCYISPDMRFMPCSFGNKEEYGIKIDTSDPKSLQNIWNTGEPFLKFRKVLQDNPASCPYEL